METLELTIKSQFWEMIKNKEKIMEFRKWKSEYQNLVDKKIKIVFKNHQGKVLGSCLGYGEKFAINGLLEQLSYLVPICDDISEIRDWEIQKIHLDFLLNPENGYFKDLKGNEYYFNLNLYPDTLEVM